MFSPAIFGMQEYRRQQQPPIIIRERRDEWAWQLIHHSRELLIALYGSTTVHEHTLRYDLGADFLT